MKLFNLKNEPVFLKKNSDMEDQVSSFNKLILNLNSKGQELINREIKLLEYGIIGEKNIEFELKNIHMPIYVLHDIYLKYKDLSAQIDYLVFTKKLCFVIECKNLYGDIQVDNRGNFIRTTEFNGRKKREGIYSPITQNQRHLDLIKKIIVDQKDNFLTRFIADRSFEDYYKSVVVLANPKTVLNTKYAKKEVKDKVIRADQLVNYIKKTHNESKELPNSTKGTRLWAESFLDRHQEIEKDYTQKYEKYKIDAENNHLTNVNDLHLDKKMQGSIDIPIEERAVYNELKTFRLRESRKENIPPYYIFNNKELERLVITQPRNKIELREIEGFGDVKTEKYGDKLIKIIEKFASKKD